STESWTYDANRNVLQHVWPDAATVGYVYDGLSRLKQTNHPTGVEEEIRYDLVSNVLEHETRGTPGGGAPSAVLALTVFVRDEKDRLVEEQRVLLAAVGPPQLSVWKTLFDRLDRPTQSEEPDGQQAFVRYDGLSRTVETEDALGNLTQVVYDANDNVVSTTEVERGGGVVSDESFTTTFLYDALDRVTSTTDNIGQTTTFIYDSRDNLVGSTDAEGNFMRHVYDSLNRKVREEHELRVGGTGVGEIDVSNPFNADGLVTLTYAYDKNSRMTSVRDDEGNETAYGYDALNRVVREQNADGTARVFAYNRDDTVRETTDPNGTRVVSTYDDLNRLTRLDVTRGSGVVGTEVETHEYDGLSRVLQSTDDNGSIGPTQTVNRSYDSLSRVVLESQNGAVFAYTYSLDSKLLTCTYPGGRVISHGFDALDRPVTTSDGAGVIAACTFIGPGLRELRRNLGDGTQQTALDASGLTDEGYDGIRRIVRSRCLLPGGSAFVDRSYAYNHANIITSETRGEDFGLTDSYEYDSLYRIVRSQLDQNGSVGAVERQEVELSYGLDGVGNRRALTSVSNAGSTTTIGYSVNEVNEYLDIDGTARAYDSNGNLIDDGMRIFRYDYKNRLAEVEDKASGDSIATYLYDVDNRRTRKTVYALGGAIAEETDFLYRGWQVCEEREATTGDVTTTYVYGPRGLDDACQVQRTSSHSLGLGTLYLHQDIRGNVVAVTENAVVVERRTYDDYGNAVDDAKQGVVASTVGNPYGFQGRRIDTETELYYFRNRYYEPATGRFLQRDAIWDPPNLGNQYAFVGNSPISNMDPSGLILETGWDLASFGVGIASLTYNLSQGNWGDAALDLLGVVVDAGALLIPGVPGGAGMLLKAFRGVDKANDLCRLRTGLAVLNAADDGINGALSARAAHESFEQGDTGMGMLQAMLGGVGAAGSLSNVTRAVRGMCFLEGTLVETRDGRTPIEDVRVGDEVLSRDEATGEHAYKRVVRLFRGDTDSVVYLRLSDRPAGRTREPHRVGEATASESEEPPLSSTQIIRSTVGHPYYVAERGWVRAGELKVGDRVEALTGEALHVVEVTVRPEQAQHYNFEVADWHTYFVSGQGGHRSVWTHNKRGGCGQQRGARRAAKVRRRAARKAKRAGRGRTTQADDVVIHFNVTNPGRARNDATFKPAFSSHLAEQQAELNRLSLGDPRRLQAN
ncbi:polymorphic toxin-type HINT domain-containing protein, partial [Planctomycetota bacterium]|nr:polymorphic toxin-type HINT domain-containing protein [Planctomycetota bacterium]